MLGVKTDATSDEIKSAFIDKSKKVVPADFTHLSHKRAAFNRVDCSLTVFHSGASSVNKVKDVYSCCGFVIMNGKDNLFFRREKLKLGWEFKSCKHAYLCVPVEAACPDNHMPPPEYLFSQ